MYVIAIANQKGGVAKTTTVVSLGGALVKHNQEVLLVDLDAQSNLTLALGKDPTKVRDTISEVLFESASLISVSRETSIPGLDLVPSNSSMDVAERFLPVRKNYETILRRSLDGMLEPRQDSNLSAGEPEFLEAGDSGNSPRRQHSSVLSYDYVLLDCPPSMGAVTLNALAAADMLIIPSQPEYFSAHALRTMMTTVRQVRSQYNQGLQYRILITLMDRRNRIHRDVCQHLIDTFKDSVFQTIIEIDTKIRESAVEGLPITHRRRHSRSALQYDALAQELIQYVQQAKPTGTSGSAETA